MVFAVFSNVLCYQYSNILYFWWSLSLFSYFLFLRLVPVLRRVQFTYSNFAWGYGLEACLFKSCIAMLAVKVKVSRETVPSSPMGIDSADTIANRPMWRFAWTNHIYFQITQPVSRRLNSPMVAAKYQWRRLNYQWRRLYIS
jgi:hypothetical protein